VTHRFKWTLSFVCVPLQTVAYAENLHGDSVAYCVIRIWCALFVTSYSCIPNQHFGKVCADQP